MTPSKPTVFNLPNQLTLARFVLALVLFVLITVEWWLWCLIVFIVAAFTDWLDGYLARLHNITSTLGRNLDPLVDKVLMCGAFVFLLPLGSKRKLVAALDGNGGGGPRADHHQPAQLPGNAGSPLRRRLDGQGEDGFAVRRRHRHFCDADAARLRSGSLTLNHGALPWYGCLRCCVTS